MGNISQHNQSLGDCVFVLTSNGTRVSQFIDLKLYSRLIDLGNAMFSASAFFGCNGSNTSNASYVEVSAHSSDGNLLEIPIYLSKIIR